MTDGGLAPPQIIGSVSRVAASALVLPLFVRQVAAAVGLPRLLNHSMVDLSPEERQQGYETTPVVSGFAGDEDFLAGARNSPPSLSQAIVNSVVTTIFQEHFKITPPFASRETQLVS